MSSSSLERRVHPRYPLEAALKFTYAGQTYPGAVHDLSKGGLSFWCNVELPTGAGLTLALTLIVGKAQATLTTQGLICWQQSDPDGPFRYGVAFSQLNPAQLKVLAEFLGGTGAPPVRNSP